MEMVWEYHGNRTEIGNITEKYRNSMEVRNNMEIVWK